MCGIAGFVLRDGIPDPTIVRAMCDRIRHRGPDDDGYYLGPHCALGMRRLSIIDLDTGHQPISNEDGTVWVVFNGEIYNYRQIRAGLEARSHRFSTASDTEILVHLYEEEGLAGLDRLRGMFVFAIWDASRRRLLIARDRFGKKPLYFADLPGGLYFGSELKCLQAAGVSLGELDPEALRLYFLLGYVPEPFSPLRAVRKLDAGGYLVFENGQLSKGRYWRLPPPALDQPAAGPVEDTRRLLRETFDEAVRIRMISDVPLGAFLSGGIDSSCVVASMAMQSPEPVRTFSIGFPEASFSELEWARLVARRFQTEHHEIVVEPDSVSLVSRLVGHFDEPFGDSSAIPTFIVSQFAARHVKVVLSGDGGDELFAGYESVLRGIHARRIWDSVPHFARRALAWTADRLPYSAYGKNYLRAVSRGSALERYFESNCLPHYLRKALLEPGWMFALDEANLTRVFADCLLPLGTDILIQALYFEATSKLVGDMLVKVDRMSMANSLEVRCPFLDQELAHLAARIPYAWKYRNGVGKSIVREALGDRLPPELLNRPKMGFGVPLAKWFRGSLRGFLRDHLTSRECLERGVVSPAFVRYLLDEHDSGRRDNCHWLWMLLMFELWCRAWSASPEGNLLTCAHV
jgi:asparagine synthase (glutamine-hydrolysing)